MRTLTETTKRKLRPQSGMWIVWRYKGNKGWDVSYVRDSFGGGYVVHLTDSEYSNSGSKVCVDDIDWKLR